MNIRIAAAGAVLAMSIGLSSAGAQATQTVDVRVQGPNDTYLAIEVLKTITVQNEYSRGYKRSLFKHWLDIDGDGCDAREQVLKRDAIGLPQVDPFKCFVVEADWLSPYDGVRTSDRTRVDIDHTVALKEAWDSGAWQWNEAQRTAFANDTSDARSLIAASSSSNRSKGDRDPSNWMPPLRGYWCTYSANWIAVKARWGLSMDQSEWGRLNNVLSGQCAGTTMRGWSDVAGGAPSAVRSSTGRSSATTVASASASTTVAAGGSPVVASLRPGSFCVPEGATGVVSGRAYVCAKTDVNGNPYTGNRARWRQQTSAPSDNPSTTPSTTSNTVPSNTVPVNTVPSSATTVASASTSTTVAPGGSPVVTSLRPGSFCAPEGATGSSNGRAYVCAKTDVSGKPYAGNRARWRQQT